MTQIADPEDPAWTWPNPPETPREIIADVFGNWGRTLAFETADDLLAELALYGYRIVREPGAKP